MRLERQWAWFLKFYRCMRKALSKPNIAKPRFKSIPAQEGKIIDELEQINGLSSFYPKTNRQSIDLGFH